MSREPRVKAAQDEGVQVARIYLIAVPKLGDVPGAAAVASLPLKREHLVGAMKRSGRRAQRRFRWSELADQRINAIEKLRAHW